MVARLDRSAIPPPIRRSRVGPQSSRSAPWRWKRCALCPVQASFSTESVLEPRRSVLRRQPLQERFQGTGHAIRIAADGGALRRTWLELVRLGRELPPRNPRSLIHREVGQRAGPNPPALWRKPWYTGSRANRPRAPRPRERRPTLDTTRDGRS